MGLPKWLSDQKNQNLAVLFYVIFLLVIIPSLVYSCYQSTKDVSGEEEIMNKTLVLYCEFLFPNTPLRGIIELFSLSSEFVDGKNIKIRSGEQQHLRELYNQMIKENKMHKPGDLYQHTDPSKLENLSQVGYRGLKTLILIHAYMNRLPNLNDNDMEDLQFILQKAPALLENMITMVFHPQCRANHIYSVVNTIITFYQCMMQGLNSKDSEYKQFPYLTDNEIKHIVEGKKGVKSLLEYLCLAEYIYYYYFIVKKRKD